MVDSSILEPMATRPKLPRVRPSMSWSPHPTVASGGQPARRSQSAGAAMIPPPHRLIGCYARRRGHCRCSPCWHIAGVSFQVAQYPVIETHGPIATAREVESQLHNRHLEKGGLISGREKLKFFFVVRAGTVLKDLTDDLFS